MPRAARRISSTGIYHIMLRGIDCQKIFKDRNDFSRFLIILRECKNRSNYKLYAYCLMPNHVHLLLKSENESIDTIMKSIAGRYASWFNFKYQRKGHLFQDRYKSECVENEEYFLTALRYIMQNPIKAKLESKMGVYTWSSYREYTSGENDLTDVRAVIKMFGNQLNLVQFIKAANDDKVMDTDEDTVYRKNDAKVNEIYRFVTGLQNEADFLKLEENTQKEFMNKMHENGISLVHIARIAGISKSRVYRILKGLA